MARRWNNISIALGRKGSGKTELSKYITAQDTRLIVWDYLGQFDCNDICKHSSTIERLLKHSHFNIAVRLPDHYFPFICQFVKQTGDCTFLIDEVDMICSPTSIDPHLDNLIRYGRHYVRGDGEHGVDLVCTSRRPAEVHRNLTANADDIYVYQTHEPRDLAYLSKFMNIDQIRELKQYECLHYNALEQSYKKEKVPASFVK